jgi:hypothetical protein
MRWSTRRPIAWPRILSRGRIRAGQDESHGEASLVTIGWLRISAESRRQPPTLYRRGYDEEIR